MANEHEDQETTFAGPDAGLVHPGLSKGERRIVERIRRARVVAQEAAPDLPPTFDDLLDLAEMIEDAGG